MKYQTRNQSGEIREYNHFFEALEASRNDKSIWKISFVTENGDRIRLIRENNQWIYEDIAGFRQ